MADLGFTPRIARTTYRRLQRVANIQHPIHIEDRLQDLGMNPRMIATTIRSLMDENDRLIPTSVEPESIVTVKDLALLVQCSPRAAVALAA